MSSPHVNEDALFDELDEDKGFTEQKKKLKLTVHGKRTDVVHGRTLAITFGFIGLGALGVVGLSVYIIYFTDMVANGGVLAEALKLEREFNILIYVPVIYGSIISVFCLIAIIFSLFTVQAAKRFNNMVEETFGVDHVNRDINSKFGGVVKCIVYFVKILILVLAILQLGTAATARGFLDQLERSIDSGESASQDPESFSSQVITFQFALFNTCCFQAGYAQQDEVGECPVSSCGLSGAFVLFQDTLCQCYLSGNNDDYTRMLELVNKSDSCADLAAATVKFSPTDSIPGTTLDVSSVFERQTVSIVGDPAEDGCGNGFSLGFQFVHYRYFYNIFSSILTAFVAISCLQLLAILYGFYINFVGVEQAVVDAAVKEEYVRKRSKLRSGSKLFSSPLFKLSRKRSKDSKSPQGSVDSKQSWGSLLLTPIPDTPATSADQKLETDFSL